MQTKQELIQKVNDDPTLLAKFQAGWGRQTIEDYLKEYGHVWDIVGMVSAEIGIAT
jgi:hypothetical protein